MSEERRTTSNEASDPLDAMLAQARWPQASDATQLRLARAYRAARMRDLRTMILVRGAVALAASILIVLGIARFTTVDRPVPTRTATPVVRIVKYQMPRPIQRPPTQLELIILKLDAKPKATAVREPEVQNRPEIADVSASERERRLFERLLRNRSAESIRTYLDLSADESKRAAAMAVLDGISNPPIEQFIAALHDPLVDRRIAAARVLGHINGPDLTARLIEMTERADVRREAMIALACSRGEMARRFVDRASESGPLVSLARSVRVQYDTH